ncbi:hypothetical protein MMC10_009184 [Thelotrema lepadinum]|nr:hypothetical protein [Thelotrema lepadinum]
MSPISPIDKLSSTPDNWVQRATGLGVADASVHDLAQLDSASKMGAEQFFALRVLWKRFRGPEASGVKEFFTGDHRTRAKQALKGNAAWQLYIETIHNKATRSNHFGVEDVDNLGMFGTARVYQDRVIRPDGASGPPQGTSLKFEDTIPKIEIANEFSQKVGS